MRKAALALLALALCANVAGGPGMLIAEEPSSSFLGGLRSSRSKSSLPVSTTPEAFTRQAQQQGSREVVAPALGYEPAPKPGPFTRMKNAITESKMGQSVGKLFKKREKSPPASPPDSSDPVVLANKPKPPNAGLYVAMARLKERSRDLEGAEKHYQKALSIDPNDEGALLGYARLLDRQGDFETALKHYQQATRAHPGSAAAFNDLGLCFARQNQLEQAVPALSKAVELAPDRTLYRNNLATVLVEAGRADQALEHLVVVHGPAVGHYNLGFLLSQSQRFDQAAEHFDQALAIDPSFDAARQWREICRAKVSGKVPELAQAPRRAERHPLREPAAEPADEGSQTGVHAFQGQAAWSPQSSSPTNSSSLPPRESLADNTRETAPAAPPAVLRPPPRQGNPPAPGIIRRAAPPMVVRTPGQLAGPAVAAREAPGSEPRDEAEESEGRVAEPAGSAGEAEPDAEPAPRPRRGAPSEPPLPPEPDYYPPSRF